MDNIIKFSEYIKPIEMQEDPIAKFVHDYLLPWAEEHGIDINTPLFKHQGATIMTCLQGMLIDVQ
jgi:hypothetical protein